MALLSRKKNKFLNHSIVTYGQGCLRIMDVLKTTTDHVLKSTKIL